MKKLSKHTVLWSELHGFFKASHHTTDLKVETRLFRQQLYLAEQTS